MYKSTLFLSGLATIATLGVLSLGAPTASAHSSIDCHQKSSYGSCGTSKNNSSSHTQKQSPKYSHGVSTPKPQTKYVPKHDDNKSKMSHPKPGKPAPKNDCKPHKVVHKPHVKPNTPKPKTTKPVSVSNPAVTVASTAAPAPVAKTALANTGSNLIVGIVAIVLMASALYVARRKQTV